MSSYTTVQTIIEENRNVTEMQKKMQKYYCDSISVIELDGGGFVQNDKVWKVINITVNELTLRECLPILEVVKKALNLDRELRIVHGVL